MSEKPEVTAALVIGLGSALGKVIEDATARLHRLGAAMDPTPHLRNLVDDLRATRYTLDMQYHANERNAGETRLALRRIVDLLAQRPVTIGRSVTAERDAPAPINDRQRVGDGIGKIAGLSSIGDVLRSSVELSFGFRSRLMQLRQASGLPYDEAAEVRLGKTVNDATESAAMPLGKTLDLADAMSRRRLSLDDTQTLLAPAARFAQGQDVSLATTAALVQQLQQKAGVETAAAMERALAGIAWRAQQQGLPVEVVGKQMLDGLARLGPGDRKGADALLAPAAGSGWHGVMPDGVLQAGVDARRNSPLGQLEAAEQSVSGALIGIGSLLLKSDELLRVAAVVGAGLLAVKAAIGVKQFAQDAKSLLPGNWSRRDVQDVFVTNWPDLGGGGSRSGTRRKGPTGGKRSGGARSKTPAARGGIVQRAGAVLGRAGSWLGGAVGKIGASGIGRAAGGLARGAGSLLRRVGPFKALASVVDVASVYSSNDSPRKKKIGYGKAAGSSVGAAAGAALGTFIPIPVVGTLVGGAIGALVGEYLGGKAGEQAGKPSDPPRASAPAAAPVATVSAPPATTAPPNWTFSPQVNISVAGNIVNPQQLIDELLPAMRRLIGEAQQERQRNALFDTVVV